MIMSFSAATIRMSWALAVLVLFSGQALAHFPWLTTDDDGRALLFFGESTTERDYHLPEALAAAKPTSRVADAEPTEVAMEVVEEEKYVGRRSNEPVAEDAVLELTSQYGIYHGMLLTYYAKHLPGATI